jgi:transposase
LDRADVLTMAAGDPAYDELQGQEFEVSLSGEGKVQVADKLLSKSIDYSAI